MAERMRWVGLDVHAQQTVATVFCPGTGEIEQRRIEVRPVAVVDWLVDLPRPVRAVYGGADRVRARAGGDRARAGRRDLRARPHRPPSERSDQD